MKSFDKVIEISSPYVSLQGRKNIESYIASNVRANGWSWSPPSSMFDSVGIELTTNQGRMTKRIQKYLREYPGADVEKLTSEQVSAIGNLANEGSIKKGSYRVRLSRNIDIWDHAGEAGEHRNIGLDTCYSEEGEYHWCWRLMAQSNDFGVLLLHEDSGRLLSRCWVYSPDEDTYILFNAYGLTLQKNAMLMKLALGDTFESDKISIQSSMYINNNMGSKITTASSYFRDRGYVAFGEDYNSCSWCSEIQPEDSLMYVEDRGCYICGDCLDYHYDLYVCDCCGDVRSAENEGQTTTEGDLIVCNDCLENHFIGCRGCGGIFDYQDINGDGDDAVCDDCLAKKEQRENEVISAD